MNRALARWLSRSLPLILCVGSSGQARADDQRQAPVETSDEPVAAPVRRAPAEIGQWLESGAFRFRIEAIRDCGQQLRGAAPSGALHWLAFEIRIVAGPHEVLVSPRDVTLESKGVILQPENVVPAVDKRCRPQLTAQRLSSRRPVRGTLIFAVPPEFAGPAGDVLLVYRPTRWGGAGRLEVRIPACLDHCPERSQSARKPRPELR